MQVTGDKADFVNQMQFTRGNQWQAATTALQQLGRRIGV
jgi:hypothetical protein